ncbi:hypothetical protein CHARACLAT_029621 [Characodon lateralis]|uniref:Uncharacterized protein n=1 Tax=Characodon lateralis TaxID=208331 RepID=A0ABU7CSD1_9TELE|nr:hypothetical protein [Characodon lateralis]
MYLFVCRSKRLKSASIEEDADSPGAEYYHSPASPASNSRNWNDDLEGVGSQKRGQGEGETFSKGRRLRDSNPGQPHQGL